MPPVTSTAASDAESLQEINEEIVAVIDPQTDPEPVEATFDLNFDPQTEVAATLSLGGLTKPDNLHQSDVAASSVSAHPIIVTSSMDLKCFQDPADPNQVTVVLNGSLSPSA
jgi:hypothetical protein